MKGASFITCTVNYHPGKSFPGRPEREGGGWAVEVPSDVPVSGPGLRPRTRTGWGAVVQAGLSLPDMRLLLFGWGRATLLSGEGDFPGKGERAGWRSWWQEVEECCHLLGL